MFAQSTRNHMKCLVLAAMTLALGGVCIAPTAFAGVVLNTIDTVALMTDHGRHIIATGPLACTASELASLRVTVTQRATGAVAEGHTSLTCTGTTQPWEVHAGTQGKEAFQAGPATAVAVGRTTARGDIMEAHQWLVTITLVGE